MKEVGLFLGPQKAAALLEISMKDLHSLVRSGQLEEIDDVTGKKVYVESIITYLGKRELKRRMGRIDGKKSS